MRASLDHGSLDDSHQATVNLTNLTQHKHKQIATHLFMGIMSLQQTSSCNQKTLGAFLPDRKQYSYHSIAAVTGEDDNIDWRGVVSDTDASILGFILTKTVGKKAVILCIIKSFPSWSIFLPRNKTTLLVHNMTTTKQF